ncbi:MAG: NrdH-redoxin [Spirochaetes bacterium]|nr:MAG: NrdH-redoxin [Spirochaetota bacterium]
MAVQKSAPRIIVFSTPSCPWCNRVKRYLKEKGFRYRDIDVSKDEKAARDVVRKTGQMGVPVILINNRPIVGFNKAEIDRLLKIRN